MLHVLNILRIGPRRIHGHSYQTGIPINTGIFECYSKNTLKNTCIDRNARLIGMPVNPSTGCLRTM